MSQYFDIFSRAMISVNKSVRVMCLCPSVTRTPILDGCTQQELDKMKNDVGGFMESKQVLRTSYSRSGKAQAFEYQGGRVGKNL